MLSSLKQLLPARVQGRSPRVSGGAPEIPGAPDWFPALHELRAGSADWNGVLVTGAPRSGTTWVGKMLGFSPSLRYIHEPFNDLMHRNRAYLYGAEFPKGLYYLCPENAREAESALARILGFDFFYEYAEPHLDWQSLRLVIEELRTARDTGVKPLMKDPLAAFSAKWVAERFGLLMVVVVRHPVDMVGSFTGLEWRASPRQLLKQPLLMRDRLEPFREELERCAAEGAPIAQAAMIWKTINQVLSEDLAAHPEWILVRQEELARNSIEGFRALYLALGLQFDAGVERQILEHTNDGNPTDPGGHDIVKRASRKNVAKWRKKLGRRDIARIRRIVEPVSWRFYGNADW